VIEVTYTKVLYSCDEDAEFIGEDSEQRLKEHILRVHGRDALYNQIGYRCDACGFIYMKEEEAANCECQKKTEKRPRGFSFIVASFGFPSAVVSGLLMGIFVAGFNVRAVAAFGILCGLALAIWLSLYREARRWK
jgi:rubredoxin